jgi:hypothetical protein
MAGDGWSDLRSGEKKLPASEAGPRHARDAAWDRGRSHKRLAKTGFLFCASSRIPTNSARSAAQARGQAGGATLSAANSGDGSRENHPTMDSMRGALLPLVAGFRLRATEARWGCSVMLRASR